VTNAPDITVCVPHIPSRALMLQRAVRSIATQTQPPAAISVAIDINRQGAPATRQRALDAVSSDWVAFLDDDDYFFPIHLEHLYRHAMETGADFVYSWFEVPGGTDPFPSTHFTNPFNPEDPIETTITTLVRTDLAKAVGFQALDRGQINTGEDRFFTLGCLNEGAKISHLVERTWAWCHHTGNTSGLSTKGDSLRW
jgi:glycosyltransferase involved in cell wall biosynthesis